MTGLTTTEKVLAARESSNVRRCHVVPHHGEYTDGKHSHDALSLLFILHPAPSMALVKALHAHDNGERWVGDMPSPAKWYNNLLGREYVVAEKAALREWDMEDGLLENLSKDEGCWLQALDRIELWLWCHDQYAMGNLHIVQFILHLDRWFRENQVFIPDPCHDLIEQFQWKRLPENPGDMKLARLRWICRTIRRRFCW